MKVNSYEICTFEIVCQSLMCVLRRVYSSNESFIRNFIRFKVYLYVQGLFTKIYRMKNESLIRNFIGFKVYNTI